jgi:hypothetical protein
MSNVAVARPIQAPDLDVVAHDFFAVDLPKARPATSMTTPLGQPAALLMGLLAANPRGLDLPTLSAATGCCDAVLERTVASLRAFGRSHQGPVLIDEADGHLAMAATHLDSLLDDLDDWALATGLAGVSRIRLAEVDQERRRFRERAYKSGKSPSRIAKHRNDKNSAPRRAVNVA